MAYTQIGSFLHPKSDIFEIKNDLIWDNQTFFNNWAYISFSESMQNVIFV